jgi:CRISPR-associated protein Csb1
MEAIGRDGSKTGFVLDLAGAIELYRDAVAALPDGMKFEKDPGVALAELVPSAKLADLVKKSRELAAAESFAAEG